MDRQEKHEKIVTFLKQFDEYSEHILQKQTVSSKNLSSSDTDKAVILLCDFFNLQGGSIGDFNLYRLLEAYITMPEKRLEFNTLADRILSEKYEKNTAANKRFGNIGA